MICYEGLADIVTTGDSPVYLGALLNWQSELAATKFNTAMRADPAVANDGDCSDNIIIRLIGY